MLPHSLHVATKGLKPGLVSLRSFRNLALTAALPLSLLCAGRAEAISTITQTVSPTTLGPFSNISFSRLSPRTSNTQFIKVFNKFDTALGTLVGIRFSGDGDLSGSFRGARSSTTTPLSSLTGGTATLSVNFIDAGWITTNTGGATSIIGASALDRTTQANIATQGTILTATNTTLNLSNSDTAGTFFSFFEGSEGQFINAAFTWGLEIFSTNLSTSGTCPSAKCTGFNFSPSGLTTGQTPLQGDINEFKLFYDYEPFATRVPAPLPILGSGVAFAYTRRLRRRIQKARITH
jgi:hypothetical protein